MKTDPAYRNSQQRHAMNNWLRQEAARRREKEMNPTDFIPSDWEIFEDMDGANEADAALAKAFVETCRRIEEEVAEGKTIPAAYNSARQILRDVMEDHADVGACDTEPRTNGTLALEEWAEERYGIQIQLPRI